MTFPASDGSPLWDSFLIQAQDGLRRAAVALYRVSEVSSWSLRPRHALLFGALQLRRF
jgi:hypothetical protein